ncbi:hypothetical protein TNCT_231691 [Trichonephila clavata]|uniref:Uncharacterized protein n=1 Tax=Trichonephila clavata TaxID=2740835 RepID=A0A8X6GXM7_TRICU|nr:hypothetical protein TNCT_231691 [Trichonephila clavata]
MPPHVRKYSDCKKRAWIISQVQNLENMIIGYATLESLPKCPANDELLLITIDAKKEAISKRQLMVNELAIIPPCIDPDCPHHTVLKPKNSDPDLITKPPQKRKGIKTDKDGFVFPKRTAQPITPTKELEPIETQNNFDNLENQDSQPIQLTKDEVMPSHPPSLISAAHSRQTKNCRGI